MLLIPRRSRLTVNYLCEEIATISGRINDCVNDCPRGWKVFIIILRCQTDSRVPPMKTYLRFVFRHSTLHMLGYM